MLLLAALSGCLDPILTVAASLSLGRSILGSAPRDQQQVKNE